MLENKTETERVILVSVSTGSQEETEDLLDELDELVMTAGAETVGRVIQARDAVSPGTYVGTGKIAEIKDLIYSLDADAVICDDELTPVQYKNLENMLDVKIMDRTLVILDIFAKHANTKEGKIQVELAQLRYRATRLIGMRNLSRQGGGIGTRGPGERKLESDRRVIRERISRLKKQVNELENHRELLRVGRKKNQVPVVAIVGYTNAGKSTLLNKLTNAGVLEENKLFATLDPTTRNYRLPDGNEILLTDTVGFIRKLPHHLIDAFKSTLEEARYADIIIHVVDCSGKTMDRQMQAVYKTLEQLGISGKPVITVFNKIDKLEEIPIVRDEKADYTVIASVKNGQGLDALEEAIEKALQSMRILVKRTYSYNEAGKIGVIRKYGQLLVEEYNENGIYIEAYVPMQYL